MKNSQPRPATFTEQTGRVNKSKTNLRRFNKKEGQLEKILDAQRLTIFTRSFILSLWYTEYCRACEMVS